MKVLQIAIRVIQIALLLGFLAVVFNISSNKWFILFLGIWAALEMVIMHLDIKGKIDAQIDRAIMKIALAITAAIIIYIIIKIIIHDN